LFRHPQKRPKSQVALLLANLATIKEALEQGSIVILEAASTMTTSKHGEVSEFAEDITCEMRPQQAEGKS